MLRTLHLHAGERPLYGHGVGVWRLGFLAHKVSELLLGFAPSHCGFWWFGMMQSNVIVKL